VHIAPTFAFTLLLGTAVALSRKRLNNANWLKSMQ